MSYMEMAIFKHVKALYRHNQAPVRARIIADLIGKGDRDVRRFLSRMEQRGIVARQGQRGGWYPLKQPRMSCMEFGLLFLAGCEV